MPIPSPGQVFIPTDIEGRKAFLFTHWTLEIPGILTAWETASETGEFIPCSFPVLFLFRLFRLTLGLMMRMLPCNASII